MKKRLLLLTTLCLLLVGCDSDVPLSEDEILNSGGAYKTEISQERDEVEEKENDEIEEDNETKENTEENETEETKNETGDVENEQDKTQDKIENEDKKEYEEDKQAIKILAIQQLTMESEEFDEDLENIDKETHKLNGYIHSHKIEDNLDSKYIRQASMSLRIPKANSERFINYLEKNYSITRTQSETVDATKSYYDIESQIETLEKQEQQLLSMYEKTTDVEDVIKIGDRLAQLTLDKNELINDYEHMKERLNFININIIINEKKPTGLNLNKNKEYNSLILSFFIIIASVTMYKITMRSDSSNGKEK